MAFDGDPLTCYASANLNNAWAVSYTHLDFCDYYERTGDKEYLEKAIQLHDYIYSGWSEELGGGIYWCEQKKDQIQ